MTINQNLHQAYDWFSGAPLHIAGIAVLAVGIQRIGSRGISKAMNRLGETDLVPGPRRGGIRQRERSRAAGTVLRSAMNAAIFLIASSMILSELGFNLGPIIASAGVVGVALGLGAQSIVRDVLAGIFMLIEDQYGVGDEVEVMDIRGAVESIGLRITTVRAQDQTLWYLRNGEILKLGNHSQPIR